jgi:ribonuclease I
VNAPRLNKATITLLIAVIGSLVTWYSHRDTRVSRADTPTHVPSQEPASPQESPNPAPGPRAESRADFDFYLLTLSIHPAFCADGHSGKSECRTGGHRSLVLHGLWPENLEPGAYSHDCTVTALHLEGGLSRELADFMPGMESDLHEHEWRKHGGCSGLEANDYFRHALDLTRAVDAALGSKLTTLAGRETTSSELRETAERQHAGLGATLTFQCRNLRGASQDSHGRPFLIEIRQCVDNDGANGAPSTLLDCRTVNRRDQGCGGSFYVARPQE